MNFLDQLLRGGTPQRPAAYPREGNIEDDFAMMADAGWFNAPQANPQVTQFDPMATDSRLGNAPQVEKEKNQLNTLFQGALFAGDLEKAARLAVTAEQQALLNVAYGDRMSRQAGQQATGMAGYQRAQDRSLERSRLDQDRAMKMAEMAARTKNLESQAQLRTAQAGFVGKPRPGSAMKAPETAAQLEFSKERAKLDAKELDDLRNASLKAQGGIQRVQQMKGLADDGVYTGTLAEARVGVANFFDTLGVPFDKKKLVNSQEYMKHAKELTLNVLKEGVGASQISNADLKFVNDTVPQLDTNPKARKDLLDFIERKLQWSVDRFSKAEEYATANNSLRGFKYEMPADAPGAKPADAGKEQRYLEWKKKQGY